MSTWFCFFAHSLSNTIKKQHSQQTPADTKTIQGNSEHTTELSELTVSFSFIVLQFFCTAEGWSATEMLQKIKF